MHERIPARGEKFFVAGEKIMFPQMLAEPRATADPDAVVAGVDGRGAAPEVGVVVQHPAARAVMRLGGLRAGHGAIGNHVEERCGAFGKIRHFGGPVIHLGVDVHRPFAVPRRMERVIPDALQIRGLTTGAAAGDEQIPAILKRQRGKVGVAATGKIMEPLVRRQFRRGGLAEIERHAPEQRLMIRNMRL